MIFLIYDNLSLMIFRLNHFMGPVKYNINTFVEKNKNCLSPMLCSTMYNGTHPLLKSLFPEGNIIQIN